MCKNQLAAGDAVYPNNLKEWVKTEEPVPAHSQIHDSKVKQTLENLGYLIRRIQYRLPLLQKQKYR